MPRRAFLVAVTELVYAATAGMDWLKVGINTGLIELADYKKKFAMFFICRLFYSQMCIFTFCLNTWDKNDNSARPLSLHAASCFFLLHFPLFDLTCSPTPLGVVRVHFVCVRACACARVHADDAPHPEDRPRACVCVYARAPTRKMINYVNQNVKMLRTARTNTLQQFLCVCGLANECLIVLALTLDRDPA